LTQEGAATGTPAYMAPEIAMGRLDIDGRADLYSLGCVGYWLMAGQLVFQAETAMAMLMSHVQEQPVPPSRRTHTELPETLERVILQCLAKNPADRPANAERLIDLLAACEGIEPWTQKQAEQWWRTHMPRNDAYAAVAATVTGDETL
jgi:serine/threonine-protein kinase